MTETTHNPFKDKIPEDVRQHMRAAREELRESIRAFMPPRLDVVAALWVGQHRQRRDDLVGPHGGSRHRQPSSRSFASSVSTVVRSPVDIAARAAPWSRKQDAVSNAARPRAVVKQ